MKKAFCSVVLLCGGIFLLAGIATVSASELVYQPNNPSFGGNPSNGIVLLNEAQAQSSFTAPVKDPLTQFNESLNRLILSRLTSKIVGAAFGDFGIQPGHYEMGNYSIDITADADGLGFTVNIVDTTNNNSTTVQIPYQ